MAGRGHPGTNCIKICPPGKLGVNSIDLNFAPKMGPRCEIEKWQIGRWRPASPPRQKWPEFFARKNWPENWPEIFTCGEATHVNVS